MRRIFLSALLSSAVLFLAAPSMAAVETYGFDTAHTQVIFFVNHLGFSNSEGEFHDFDGEIAFDRADPAKSSVTIDIKTASIDMDDEKWNDHMKNADFFNVEKFPSMTFKSTAIEVTGEKTAKITGDLTILGVTKPVVLDTVFNKADKHPMNGKNVAGFSATAKIKRSDFGMAYGLPMVGDDVDIRIEVEGQQKDGAPVNP